MNSHRRCDFTMRQDYPNFWRGQIQGDTKEITDKLDMISLACGAAVDFGGTSFEFHRHLAKYTVFLDSDCVPPEGIRWLLNESYLDSGSCVQEFATTNSKVAAMLKLLF